MSVNAENEIYHSCSMQKNKRIRSGGKLGVIAKKTNSKLISTIPIADPRERESFQYKPAGNNDSPRPLIQLMQGRNLFSPYTAAIEGYTRHDWRANLTENATQSANKVPDLHQAN